MRSAASTGSHGRALPLPRNSRDQVASDYFKDLMGFNVIYWVLLGDLMGFFMGFDGIHWGLLGCTLWQTNSLLLKMAIEMLELAIKHGDFP